MILRRTPPWRDLPGYEGRYRVSIWGDVLSAPTQRRTWPKILKAKISKRGGGYRIFTLSGGEKLWYAFASHLVLLTFRGPCPEGLEACHADGDSQNDRLDNLRWDTHRNNLADREILGTVPRGVTHGNSLLNDATVLEIRTRLYWGELGIDLALEYGLDPTTVSNIKVRKTWRHL